MKLSRLELLRRTRALLGKPSKWRKGRLSDKGFTASEVQAGTAFCIIGAAARVAMDAGDKRALNSTNSYAVTEYSLKSLSASLSTERLAQALGFDSYNTAWNWNDNQLRTHPQVLCYLDKLIKELEQ